MALPPKKKAKVDGSGSGSGTKSATSTPKKSKPSSEGQQASLTSFFSSPSSSRGAGGKQDSKKKRTAASAADADSHSHSDGADAGAKAAAAARREADAAFERRLRARGADADALAALRLLADEGNLSLQDAARLAGFDAGEQREEHGSAVAARTDKGKGRDDGAGREAEREPLPEVEIRDVFLDGNEEAEEDKEDFDRDEYFAGVPRSEPKREPDKEPGPGPSRLRPNGKAEPEKRPVPDPPRPRSTAAAAPFDLAVMDRAIEAIPLHEDIFTFDPVRDVDSSAWPKAPAADGSGVLVPTAPYALMAHAFTLISSTRSRLAITTLLTNLLRVIRAHDAPSLLAAVYLVSNHIAPAYDGVELGLGGSIINKAIADVTGASRARMAQLWNATGDAGDVAFEAKKGSKTLVQPVPITVAKLYASLQAIAAIKGTGSAAAKLGRVTKLLVASRGEETRFLVRTFVSHLRIQAVKTTIATALAMTFSLLEGDGDGVSASASASASASSGESLTTPPPAAPSPYLITKAERQGLLATPSKAADRHNPARLALMARIKRSERLVRQVRARHPNFSAIVPALQEVGLAGLSARVPLSIGTPLSPMLGSITRSLADMRAKLGERPFVSEFKYDGQRVQIHALFLPYAQDAPDGSPERARARKLAAPQDKGRWVKCNNGTGEVWVRLFSRHLEDMTAKYPDICDLLPLLMGHGEVKTDSGLFGVDASAGASASTSVPVVAPESEAAVTDEPPRRKIQSLIVDAEVVAIDLQGTPLPFQTLANRSRKDVNIKDVKVKVGVFAFDLMYLDGKALLKTSFRQRRKALHERMPALSPADPLIARFAHVRSCESTDMDDVAAFFEAAQASKCEGIMVKSLDHHWEASAAGGAQEQDGKAAEDDAADSQGEEEKEQRLEKLDDEVADELVLDAEGVDEDADDGTAQGVGKGVNGRGKALLSTYEPDKRCESWLKVKRDYVDGMGDSLDLVPIGAYTGMGRKVAWWSPVVLAVYDPDTGGYQAVCKCISGFSDAEYARIKNKFAEGSDLCFNPRGGGGGKDASAAAAVLDEYEYDFGGLGTPQVVFRPAEVWEVRGADITLSPVYRAALGLVSDERGLSMRFPRFLRRREDKSVDQASTPGDLARIYRAQQAGEVKKPRQIPANSSKDQEGAAPPAEGQQAASDEEQDGQEEDEDASDRDDAA